ncbi:MAG TPA: PBP1A family penicillin-binding protein [Pyrinomonadaceae bacterium]|jgi:penicillin-binding protein 1B
MGVRYPPENRVPPVAKKGKRPARGGSRIVRYNEPEAGFFRRWMRRIFRPPVIIALVFLSTVTIGILGYYWWVFSARIDNLLNGEVYTRTAGIYAAPRELRVGENLSIDELVAYLKRAAYVEKNVQAEASRGRYKVAGATVEIEPSSSAIVDNQRTFASLRIQFARGGRGIVSITDLAKGTRYEKAQLEPELISAVTGRDRSKRKVVGFNDLPKNLVNAIVVTEDRSFFEHYGVNIRGILRALIRRYDADPNSPIARQGGSSITQQLVKNLLLSPERSMRRKLAEAYLSIILETRLSKEKIFELYSNQVYLGQQSGFSINGFGEAADAYFNKDVSALTLPEAAFLAGLIRSPNRYNPYHDVETATARRNQVLESMAETGAISQADAEAAEKVPLKVATSRGRVDVSDAPYFLDYAQEQLADTIPDQGAARHLRVYTSIDMELQRAAYSAVNKQLSALDKIYAKRNVQPGTLQAALVAMNPRTGEIIAMVGGRDYTRSQLNRASTALRQPGSVFKPFVYATALNSAYDAMSRVITPATVYMDEPKTFNYDDQEYSPGNFGDQYSNAPVTLRDALARSLNVVTVEVAMDVTIGRVMNLATKAGLPKPAKSYPSMALGANEATPLQMASAYTAFAAGGSRITPLAVTRVATGDGTTIAKPTGQRNQVLRPDVAYVLTDMLKDVVNRGTAARLGSRGFKNVPGKTGIAGKTGTSRDGWFAGYTPNLVCVVWVGFDDGSQLGLTGADSALPIWADFMTAALNAHPEWGGDWQMPEGIQQAEIDTRTGKLAASDTPGENRRTEIFINGTAPTSESTALPEDSTTNDGTQQQGDDGYTYEPAPLPGATPTPTPRSRSARPDSTQDSSTRLEGTITLDIDPSTGLIADPNVCPVIRSKTYIIGQEPRQYCGPQYHGGTTRRRQVTQ